MQFNDRSRSFLFFLRVNKKNGFIVYTKKNNSLTCEVQDSLVLVADHTLTHSSYVPYHMEHKFNNS